MGRIATVLLKARDSLSDPNATRWSNDRLLRLLDEAQIDIATKARLLRTYIDIPIKADIAEYNLPSEALIVSRCLNTNGAIVSDVTTNVERTPTPIRSHEQMDIQDLSWESRTGDGVEALIFDKMNPGKIKVYPIPTTADNFSAYATTSDFGPVTDSTGDIVDVFGVVTDITTSSTLTASFTSDFGMVTDMETYVTSLVVYYYKKPMTLDDYSKIDVDQELEIDTVFDKALKHYIVGMALRDDKDTQNRQLGNEELMLYAEEMRLAMSLSSTDNLQATPSHSSYNTGFEN